MENNFALVMLFWDDGQVKSDRLLNVKYTWKKLKELCNELKKNDIKFDVELFDFSNEQKMLNATHIPYPLGEYKKSEKNNIVLNKYKNYSHIIFFDCDTFFYNENYMDVINLLKSVKENTIITFDLAKLNKDDSLMIIKNNYIDIEKTDWQYAYSGNKKYGPLSNGRIGALGGIFLSSIPLLLKIGGFDEKYVGWGGEDGEIMDRICGSKISHEIISCRTFSPFHLYHFVDYSNKKYVERFKTD